MDRVKVALPVGWLLCHVAESGRVTYAEIDDLPTDLPAKELATGYLEPAYACVRHMIATGRTCEP